MYPPTVLTDDQRNELQGRYVYRGLVKKLSELTKHFTAMHHMCADEPGGTVVIASASTFEKPAARCVSVVFDKAVANVAYDDFSHGFNDQTTVRTAQVDVSAMKVEEGVEAVVNAMIESEPLFGNHVRSQRAEVERIRQIQANKWADTSRRYVWT